MKQHRYTSGLNRSRGLALVELMIAMTLGLILIGAATGIMLSNSQSFRAAQNLSKAQESARLGFELIARDIRQAGSIPCGNGIHVENLLSDSDTWYFNWIGKPKNSLGTSTSSASVARGQLIGYPAAFTITGLTNKAANTQSITMLYASNEGASVKSRSTEDGKQAYKVQVSHRSHSFDTGDIAFLCNQDFASIFVADVTADDNSLKITTQNGQKLSDAAQGLFNKNATVGKLKSRAWYIGNNKDQKKSLYLAEWTGSELSKIEIATGVSNLSFQYRLKDTADFKDPTDIAADQWPLVNAVAVTLEFEDPNTMPGEQRIKRSFTSIVALRNRSQ